MSVSTSHFAKPSSRGSAPSMPMTVGQKPRKPSALTRPSRAVVAGSQRLVRWSRATSVTAYGITQLMSSGSSGAGVAAVEGEAHVGDDAAARGLLCHFVLQGVGRSRSRGGNGNGSPRLTHSEAAGRGATRERVADGLPSAPRCASSGG